MPDGLPASPIEPLRIVRAGVRYGVAARDMVAWLPPTLWAPAAELLRQMEAMNERADRVEALYREAEEAAWQVAADEQNKAAMRDA